MSAKQWISIGAGSLVALSAIAWMTIEASPTKSVASSTNPSVGAVTSSTIAAEPLANVAKLSPNVTKTNGSVQFAVIIPADVKPQRVEFYVESNLVAAVYAAPYVASVLESSLAAGNHQVVAKVYTLDSNVQTQSISFQSTAAPSSSNTITQVGVASPIIDESPSIPEDTFPVQIPAAPDAVSAAVNTDNSVQVTWSVVEGAVSYQVWRDSIQIGVSNSNVYLDDNTVPGRTYTYTVKAVDNLGSTSDQSAAANATVPQDFDQNAITPSAQSPDQVDTTAQ